MGTSSAEAGGDGDRPWQSYHTVYTNAKAGMEGVDKEKVQKIVYEMSKGSKYFENEKRREALMNQKVENMRAECALLTEEQLSCYQMIANKRIEELEDSRDLSKIWLHCDMDAFYAAVETLLNPSLKEKPLAVGSMSMLCTANYEARKFGVRAAMPGFIARKLCPDLILVPTNFEKYTYYSQLTRKVFQKYDPDFIATSLDEAYLNITDICNSRCISSEEVASELRNAIYMETGLSCSVGLAPNRMLAKVCSDINKPNGQFILPNDHRAVMTFISSLPIRKVGGIGKVTEHVLRGVLGISTCEEMLQKGAYLCALFSQCSSDFFLSVGLGLGGTDTPQHRSRKSISSERTFSATADEAVLFQKLADIAETMSNDMQKEGLCGKTLTLKLKTSSFEVRTRSISLPTLFHSKEEILGHASKLLKAELPLSLRLMGLRVSQFHGVKDSYDPNQKTLKSFVIQDASQSSGFRNEHHVTYGLSTDEGCSSENSDNLTLVYEADELLESNQVDHTNICSSSNDVGEMKNKDNELIAQVDSNDEGRSYNKSTLSDNNKTLSLTSLQEVSWIDDYICCVCGAELPPSLIEERQEHSDYHLAEMLQKEESLHHWRSLPHSRLPATVIQLKGSARKKQKVSPKGGKYIPINLFFSKSPK